MLTYSFFMRTQGEMYEDLEKLIEYFEDEAFDTPIPQKPLFIYSNKHTDYVSVQDPCALVSFVRSYALSDIRTLTPGDAAVFHNLIGPVFYDRYLGGRLLSDGCPPMLNILLYIVEGDIGDLLIGLKGGLTAMGVGRQELLGCAKVEEYLDDDRILKIVNRCRELTSSYPRYEHVLYTEYYNGPLASYSHVEDWLREEVSFEDISFEAVRWGMEFILDLELKDDFRDS